MEATAPTSFRYPAQWWNAVLGYLQILVAARYDQRCRDERGAVDSVEIVGFSAEKGVGFGQSGGPIVTHLQQEGRGVFSM